MPTNKLAQTITQALFLCFATFLFSTNIAQADTMEITSDPNFNNKTTSFAKAQTVYVKVHSNSEGDLKKELNLRDNNYNLLSSYTFSKSQDTYTVSLPAPQEEGTFSLEAQIESEGSQTTSVKTIKVGNTTNQNSSVKINVESKTNSSQTTNQTPSPSTSLQNEKDGTNPNDGQQQTVLGENTQDGQKSFFETVKEFFIKLITFSF